MPSIRLVETDLPEFGVPETRPEISRELYAERLARLFDRADKAGLETLAVYADREHFANMAYLMEFEPRFEEALLVLSRHRKPVIFAGPENTGRAGAAKLDADVVTYPPFGLLGQDRAGTPALADLFRAERIATGGAVGVIGWKYFGPVESPTPEIWLEVPSYIADTLREVVGKNGRVVNATALLMHASQGLRAINEIDQLAQFEFSACHVSEALKRVIFGLRPGMREFEVAALLRPIGLPFSCHPMLSSGERAAFGLESPSDKVIARGEPFTVAYGVLGALSSRAGWVVDSAAELPSTVADYLERLAAPYFACAAEWYETVGIGVTGGEIDALVRRHLGDPFFGLALNPGHLIHLDEWMNTPIYPGSAERLQSGQAIQIDIIPATGTPYFTCNIEDGIALLDELGRAAFAERYPSAWQRIEARRAFMADILGIRLKPEVLPFSNIQGYLPPFMLSPRRVFSKA
jgi:Xaa-Pro aminopeptidase